MHRSTAIRRPVFSAVARLRRPVCVCLALLGSSASAADAPTSRALLVGINDYARASIPDLRGAVNDIELMSRVLETRLGFDRNNITMLRNSQATRAAILDAIDDLVASAGPNDRVYFHYSGHGSQAPDRNGDEEDGRDETIVAQDSRQPGIPDITDDEFESRFARLKTRNVVLAFDSCHSGTVTRSVSEIQPRSIPDDDRTDLYETTTRAAVDVQSLPHVLMTGAPSDSQALDGPIDEGGFYGLFTYALVRSLEANGPSAPVQVIHEGVRQELRRIEEQWHMNPPEPQLEAPAQMMQQPLFGTQAFAVPTVRRTWVDAVAIDTDRVRLVGALTLNAQPGSQWALYGPAETRFEYGAALAVGTVESVTGNDAVLRIGVRTGPVPSQGRAIAIAPADLSNAVPVRLAGVSPERARALLDGIRKQVEVRNVGPSEFYRFSIENRGGTWHVMDAQGVRTLMTLQDGADATVAERLGGILRRSSRAMALLSLENLASDLKLWVGVQTAARASRPASSTAATRDIVLVSNDLAPTYRIRRTGEPRTHENSLIIEIQTAQPAYITVVDVDAEGGVYQLFPNPQQRDGFLPAGLVPANQLVRIPDSLAPGNAAGFYWDYSPPAGLDTVRVFATANLESAQSIRKFIADASADARALGELRSELAAAATRGVRVATDEAAPAPAGSSGPEAQSPAITGEWTATSVTINVRE